MCIFSYDTSVCSAPSHVYMGARRSKVHRFAASARYKARNMATAAIFEDLCQVVACLMLGLGYSPDCCGGWSRAEKH